jgi:signal transduction histidine kinase
MTVINFLQRQSTVRLWLGVLVISVAMSEIITSIMGLILQGEITYDYLLTGLVASFSVAGFVVAVLITFLKRLQENSKQLHIISGSLLQSEETARQAILASNSALWDLDLTTWQIYLSDGWSPFLCGEEKPTSTTLKALYELVPEEDRPMLNEAIISAMKGKNNSVYNVTHRVKKLDGNYIWVKSEGKVTERDHNGRALRMTGINRDITELKQAEDKIKVQIEQITQANIHLLESNRKLEQTQSQLLQSEKMASIGQLAAGVAHEINNPIGYVNSNFGTLRKYLSEIFSMLDKYEDAVKLIKSQPRELEDLNEFKKMIRLTHIRKETTAMLEESQQGLDHVKQIVADLKDFSHTGSEDTWKSADIQQILESSLNMVLNQLKYKCEIHKEYTSLPKVFCSPLRLNQVFINLLLNAAQAIEGHGVVTLRTGQEGGQVWIEVSDTGQGIDPKNLNRIFDPFFTTKPVGQGTGLGLALSYGIVEKHLGKIEVHSEMGKGTTFRVLLPVTHANLIDETKSSTLESGNTDH